MKQQSKNSPNIDLRPNFWQDYPLSELTHAEWEALCDGCGICCLVKFLEEEQPAESVEYTDVSCQLLNCDTGSCSDYINRQRHVPDCISLNYQQLSQMMWLPNSCAYKRLYLGQKLPEWHFLLLGDYHQSHQAMRQAGIGVAGRCVSESTISEEEIEERIIHWIDVG